MTFVAVVATAQPEPRPQRSGRKYKVRIDSTPQRAAIYLDDEKYGIVGYTPWEGRLEKGDWKLIVKLDKHETATQVVRIARRSRTQDFFVRLVEMELPATVEVSPAADTNAFGAEVWVDGELQGTIPLLTDLRKGRHLVEIKKPEHQTFSQWVDVKEGERVTIAPVLKALVKAPERGTVLVDADVPGAEVWLDGQKWPDATPTLIPDVLAGIHIVEVRKPPAMPWKQTVTVEAGKTLKVAAGLAASAGGPGGTVRVLANVEGAGVWVDGTKVGAVPLDVKDLAPGEHVLEVRAPGYADNKKRVEINAGSASVLEFELMPTAAAGARATIKVVSAVPEAAVSIDGERLGPVPQTKDVAPGEHFVNVEKPGFKIFQAKVRVEDGQTMTVTADLRQVGEVRVLSTPAAATVLLDGEPKGKTPLTLAEVEVGEHIIGVALDDFYNFEKTVEVVGGERHVVNATLKAIDLGPTPEEISKEQRGMTSFGARTLPKGRSTVDVYVGYPYFLGSKIRVGAGRYRNFGLDAGVGIRTFFSRTEFTLTGRVQLLNVNPFSLGAFADVGGGSNFFDDSGRNSFVFDAGGLLSLSALGNVTITGRAYFNFWSDRHCPAISGPIGGANTRYEDPKLDALELCDEALADSLSSDDMARIVDLLGDVQSLFERDQGGRLMTSLAVEIAVHQRWTGWVLFEGAPFQDERASFTDLLYQPMLENDATTYIQAGATYKF